MGVDGGVDLQRIQETQGKVVLMCMAVFAERLHTSLHGSTGESPGSCEVLAGKWSQSECSHRGEILGEEPVALRPCLLGLLRDVLGPAVVP